MIHAKDYTCIECGLQAVAFWPACDPDIPSHPYCRECLDKIKARVFIELMEMTDKYNSQKGGGDGVL